MWLTVIRLLEREEQGRESSGGHAEGASLCSVALGPGTGRSGGSCPWGEESAGIEAEAGHTWVHGGHEGWEEKDYPQNQGFRFWLGSPRMAL